MALGAREAQGWTLAGSATVGTEFCLLAPARCEFPSQDVQLLHPHPLQCAGGRVSQPQCPVTVGSAWFPSASLCFLPLQVTSLGFSQNAALELNPSSTALQA